MYVICKIVERRCKFNVFGIISIRNLSFIPTNRNAKKTKQNQANLYLDNFKRNYNHYWADVILLFYHIYLFIDNYYCSFSSRSEVVKYAFCASTYWLINFRVIRIWIRSMDNYGNIVKWIICSKIEQQIFRFIHLLGLLIKHWLMSCYVRIRKLN